MEETNNPIKELAKSRSGNIKKAMTEEEIHSYILSEEYSAELALQHALLLLAKTAMELEKLKQKTENQRQRIVYLEGAISWATGTPLTKMREKRDQSLNLAKELIQCIRINAMYDKLDLAKGHDLDTFLSPYLRKLEILSEPIYGEKNN
jgi:hypothetical protein